jgi:nucleoside-diphosphate-sugar epimerase
MCRHFSEDYGMNVRVARFHNSYGPHGTWRGGREKAPAAICRKVIEAVRSGRQEIEIWGDGQQRRSFMWIGDNIKGILKIMDQASEQPVNLGSSEMVTIDALVDAVQRIAGVRLRRKYDPTRPRGVHGRSCDNTRLRSLTGGWEPSTPLHSGLARTYRWIASRQAAGKAPLESTTRPLIGSHP